MTGSRGARWAAWLAAVAGATIAMYAVRPSLDKAHVTLVYLLLVLGASAYGGRVLGLVISALGFLCFDFFFLPPFATLIIANPLDWLVLAAYLVTSGVAAQLLHHANAKADEATARAVEVDRLASLGAETLNAANASEALAAIAGVILDSVGAETCDIYLRTLDGRVALAAQAGTPANASRARVAQPGGLVDWIQEHGQPAVELNDSTVRVTQAAAGAVATARALPLQVRGRTVGVLRIAASNGIRLTAEQSRMLHALAYYAALGCERARLVATAERVEAEREVERLRNALLTSVSHDLRTPLTTIKGIANEIARGAEPSRAAIIECEADRLNALVGDLLDLSRIHAGAVRPTLAVNTVDDLLGAALRRVEGALRRQRVDIDDGDNELLTGVFDFTHTLRIVVNLLENAAKYSPPDVPITIRARRRDGRIVIDVMDRGPGIPVPERAGVFESFHRAPGLAPDVGGHGLGLAIARGLAEAQGGSVTYAPRDGGGSVFTLELAAGAPAVVGAITAPARRE